MIVGICKLDLRIYECRSLKEKRQALRRIKDRTQHSFGITIAEVGSQDLWQRAELGFAIVGNDRRVIEGLMEKIQGFVEGQASAHIIDQYREIINV
ncbi:MAG: DUF503 domain-containing protein [Pseudomonadota bacterium]